MLDESVDDDTDLGAPDCVSPADGMHDEILDQSDSTVSAPGR